MEMTLKAEGFEVFTSTEINKDVLEQVKSLDPRLIITSAELVSHVPELCTKLVLGEDIELPIEPLLFIDVVRKLH